jgi:ribonuclease-3
MSACTWISPRPRRQLRKLATKASPQRSDLERRIGHRFGNPALLEQALTHRSYGSPHNERLEFLGDGVLGCVVAEILFRADSGIAEGRLSRLRAELVREESLARVARDIGLHQFLRLADSTLNNEGATRPSILADTLEAIYGAVLLDGGYDAARTAILKTYGSALTQAHTISVQKDPKTRLQEFMHAKKRRVPVYRLVGTRGPKQRQIFEVECALDDLLLTALGSGSSRQAAEQAAAENLLKQLER